MILGGRRIKIMNEILESLHCIINWSFFYEILLLRKNVCLKLKRKEKSMEASCILILVMENGQCTLICLVGVGFT